MRNVNLNIISAQENQTTNSAAIDANQLVSASFMSYCGDNQGTGTLKIQASNDPAPARNMTAIDGFTPTNWVDVPNQSASVTSGASALLTIAQSTYRWLRAVWTATGTGIQTVATVADSSGSLNSKYFLLNSANAGTGYYVWLNVNSAGVDPLIAGRTAVPIAVATNASAATIGTAITTAVDALANFAASGTTTVTITNSASGPFTPITDGAAPTGFTFVVTAGGNSTVNVNMNALSV